MTKTLSIPAGTFGGLVSENNRITKGGRTVFATTGNLALLDPAARQTTTPDAHILLDAVTKQVEAVGLKLRYVSNIIDFFNPDKRWAEFLATGTVEGLELSDDEKEVAAEFQALRKRFDTAFTLPTRPYPWLPVVEGKDPLKGVRFTKTQASNRDGYTLGLSVLKAIWINAAKHWASGVASSKTLPRRSYGGYTRAATITRTRINIGCQTISRAQMEALARKFKWEAPETSAI